MLPLQLSASLDFVSWLYAPNHHNYMEYFDIFLISISETDGLACFIQMVSRPGLHISQYKLCTVSRTEIWLSHLYPQYDLVRYTMAKYGYSGSVKKSKNHETRFRDPEVETAIHQLVTNMEKISCVTEKTLPKIYFREKVGHVANWSMQQP